MKELVDTFSILADKKDFKTQVQLFTADAALETYVNNAVVSNLKGRKAMEDSFAAFLKNFETVYHFNGQQTVKLDGDQASGVSYCMVTLIGTENGKWLIAKRKAVFDWQEKRELGR